MLNSILNMKKELSNMHKIVHVLFFYSEVIEQAFFCVKQEVPCLGTLADHGFQWLIAVLRGYFLKIHIP